MQDQYWSCMNGTRGIKKKRGIPEGPLFFFRILLRLPPPQAGKGGGVRGEGLDQIRKIKTPSLSEKDKTPLSPFYPYFRCTPSTAG